MISAYMNPGTTLMKEEEKEAGPVKEIQDLLERGVKLAREGYYSGALRVFDQNLCFTLNPTAMSYYAVALANVEGDYDRAISLCLTAAEKEFYNPEIYFNLGKILLLNGQKTLAIKAFRKGLRFDETHPGLNDELRKLGVRRRPVLSFLPRRSPLNKFLGIFSSRFPGKGLKEPDGKTQVAKLLRKIL